MQMPEEISQAIKDGNYDVIYRYFTTIRHNVLKGKIKAEILIDDAEQVLDIVAEAQAAIAILASGSPSLIKQNKEFITNVLAAFHDQPINEVK